MAWSEISIDEEVECEAKQFASRGLQTSDFTTEETLLGINPGKQR